MTYRVLKSVSLLDGRRVWICRFHSPTEGYSLKAAIPEDGFVAWVDQPVESSRVPEELLAATTATVQSYRLRPATPREVERAIESRR